MDKNSLCYGLLIGRQIAGQRAKPTVAATIKKGSVSAKPMMWPKNYSCLNGHWEVKTWNNCPELLSGSNIWSVNGKTYLSTIDGSFALDGDTWEPKVWNGTEVRYGSMVWSDGKDTYYVTPSGENFVLNGDTWEPKIWDGTAPGAYSKVWSDGANLYHSLASLMGSTCYILNGNNWEPKTWNGDNPRCEYAWSDGTDIYISFIDVRVLRGDTVEVTSLDGHFITGSDVWSDGVNVLGKNSRYNSNYEPYVLNGKTWEPISWASPGMMTDSGDAYWSDGTNIYYSGMAKDENGNSSRQHYVFVPD